MNIRVCPGCGEKSFSIFSKLRFVVDDEIFQCGKCGSSVGVLSLLRYLIMVISTAGFPFSFAYFFGKFGFLTAIPMSIVFALFLFVVLSLICPMQKR